MEIGLHISPRRKVSAFPNGKSSRKIRAKASIFLKEKGLTWPLNVESIAKKLNINIYYREKMPDAVGSTIISMDDGCFIVIVSSSLPVLHKEFAVAREVSNVVLGNCKNQTILTSALGKDNFAVFPYDLDSFLFASEILVPHGIFKRIVSVFGPDVYKLAHFFGVPEEVIEYRLEGISATGINREYGF